MQVHVDICEAAGISFSCTTAGYKVGWHNNTKSHLKGRGGMDSCMTNTLAEIKCIFYMTKYTSKLLVLK